MGGCDGDVECGSTSSSSTFVYLWIPDSVASFVSKSVIFKCLWSWSGLQWSVMWSIAVTFLPLFCTSTCLDSISGCGAALVSKSVMLSACARLGVRRWSGWVVVERNVE